MKTPILGATYVARSVNAADSRMVNLFPEIIPEGGLEPAFLSRTPGLRLLTTCGTGPIRGMWQAGTYGYVVSGTEFYRVNAAWTATKLGDVTGTGPVSIADNGIQIFIACNPDGFIYNMTTGVFQQITDPDFPGAITVSYLDGYFVFNEPDSQRFWITAIFDGTDIDALDFASAEGSPDGIVSIIVDHRELWLFGANSIEVWYDSGSADFPFTRIQGAFNEIGCAAPYSVAKLDNGLFWLGSDARGRGIVYRANGYTGQRVSTHGVEWQIQQYTDISDAIGYTYQQDGHAFYVLVFPTAKTTWVYDVATGAWHERASWINNDFDRHRGNCQMVFNNEIAIGDFENGNVYAFDLNVYDDNGDTQRWMRLWRALPTGQNDLKRTAHHALQLDCEAGVGLEGYAFNDVIYLMTQANDFLITEDDEYLIEDFIATVGADPQVTLRWSDDGGHTWSNEHWRSMGRIGQYGYRTIWRRLGMTVKLRDRVYEITGTDPVKIAIMGAELQVSPTNG